VIDIGILDSVIQWFFVWLGIISVYNYVFKKNNFKTIIKSIILLYPLALISCVIDDAMFLIFFVLVICTEKMRTGKLIFSHLNVLLVLIISQILIGTMTTYLSKWLLYGCLRVNHIADLSRHDHLFIGTQIVLMYIVGLIVLKVVHTIVVKNELSFVDFQNLKIDRQLFIILVTLFGSIELLLLVSDFQGVTATIQFTLLIMFILMIGLMSWQMIEMIQVYTRQQQLENEKQQNEQLSTYLKSVEQQYLELRKFKHDYKNLIVSLNTQTDMGKVKDYLIKANHNNVLETSLNDAKIAQVEQLKDTAIRGLVVQKFFYAKKCGVELNVETLNEPFQIREAVTIVVRVIGNLLDNAIEQAQKMADKSVTIAFNKIDDTLEISVRNAIDSTFNQQQIFTTGYSTKGQNRGLGLANVRELVDRQRQFHLDIESKAGYVTMTLIIMEDE